MSDLYTPALILLAAIILDASIGDPPWLWNRLPHPATLIGRLVGLLDRHLNNNHWSNNKRRSAGIISLLILVSATGFIGWFLNEIFHHLSFGFILEILIVAIILAQKSLYDHVNDVAIALETDGVESARIAISRIVGRDPNALDAPAINRAAIETLSENFSDAIVAPACFYLLAGLPGLFIYKAVNTADSMIGYKSERHHAFGWAAAKSDDILNLIPARLSALLIVIGAALARKDPKNSLKVMWQDAGKHTSPNAGWPESAMAGALNLALAGPRQYEEKRTDDPWLNENGRKKATTTDIRQALSVFIYACITQSALIAILAVLAF